MSIILLVQLTLHKASQLLLRLLLCTATAVAAATYALLLLQQYIHWHNSSQKILVLKL